MRDLVIFDCDGVLVDSESLSGPRLVSALRKAGLPLATDSDAQRFIGWDAPRITQWSETTYGIRLDSQFWESHSEALFAAYRRELRPLPGLLDLLESLASTPFVVCSNSTQPWLHNTLELAGLLPYFPTRRQISRSDVAEGKPAPDMHRLALERFGGRAERALVIEDSVTGAGGAVAAGIEVWGYTGAASAGPQQAAALRAVGCSRVFAQHEAIAAALETC